MEKKKKHQEWSSILGQELYAVPAGFPFIREA